jgi:hypothetical protein
MVTVGRGNGGNGNWTNPATQVLKSEVLKWTGESEDDVPIAPLWEIETSARMKLTSRADFIDSAWVGIVTGRPGSWNGNWTIPAAQILKSEVSK